MVFVVFKFAGCARRLIVQAQIARVSCVAAHYLCCLQILPTAFLASHDETSCVSGVWSTVWTEGCPSEPAALRMFAPEIAGLIAGGIVSSSWDRKKAAAKVIVT